MLIDWMTKATQALHQAVTLIDFESLFASYSYRCNARAEGSWMVAKAIQTVTDGKLYYVALHAVGTASSTFIHAAVQLEEDTFIDGHGLHTMAQLLESWSHLQVPAAGTLSLEPLFFLPAHVERDPAVIEQLVCTLEHQLRLRGDLPAVRRYRQMVEQQVEAATFYRRVREQAATEEALRRSDWY